jgi:crotonobetainyl-CoA:carnitine CoA-transferase CaiB-like acyl-CoA transferase
MTAALNGLLRGTRILDLSLYAPGPFCSLLLAELGADVVKVEEPGQGDPLRGLDPEAFKRFNRNKKSLTLNLKTEPGRLLLFRLVERSNALVEGFRPGVMERLELGYARMAKRNPRLVYLSITGYGQEGPYRDRAGHDINYMAAAGALRTEVPPIQVADLAGGGLYGALALVGGLYKSESTGKGSYIDLAMLDGVVSLLGLALSSARDILSGRYPNYGLYRTRDGKLLSVGALEPKFWEAFCQGIARPELAARIGDPTARDAVAETVASKDAAEWESVFVELDACVEPVRDSREALSHPQVVHRRMFDPELAVPYARPAASGEGAPRLGDHTGSILEELGVGAKELEDLRAQGVC